MSTPTNRRRAAALLGGAGLILGLATAVPTEAGAAPAAPASNYIVQLADAPAAGYTGAVPGYRATTPATGARIDAATTDVAKYRGYLNGKHSTVAGSVKGVEKLYDYSLTFNGFAARMTSAQAAQLAKTAGVVSVVKDEMRHVDTVSMPAFLGLSAPGGLWDQLGGPGRKGAGSGIVIGVVDSGIWPENPSFAPLDKPGQLTRFHGSCVTSGDDWNASFCTNKLVGAKYYDAGHGGDAGIRAKFPDEYVSPRDADGHGTHTSGTAAGDYDVPFIVNGNNLGQGSGMAPNARIAMYKVCWANSCTTADSMKAIEDATADGVDVINFSISGSSTSFVDPVEQQFMMAASAGVFVSASAGNSGPTASTVAHNDPWVTTVAAGTHDRAFRATVTLGNGATYNGAGLGAAVPSSPVVLSTAAGLSTAPADAAGTRLCFSSTWTAGHGPYLDPAKVAGKIVVCDRGTNDRVDKSKAVQEAGGVGVILTNTSPNSLNADFHSVPTVHLTDTDGAAVKAYVNGTANPTASLSAGVKVSGAEAPMVASFSSRGPALAAGGDLLKPDIMAPGVDVLAPIGNPAKHGGRNFDFLSGTSMAAPHIAGIAALIKQAHPTWTPMEVKSALMTSASTLDNKGNAITTDIGGTAGPLDYGSGQVTPNSAVDPGLVYDSTYLDWTKFLCGVGQNGTANVACKYGTIDPSNLNQPNIAVGDLAGTQTITRMVHNVGSSAATYTAQVSAPAGTTVTVSPTTLTIPKGRYASYTVVVTRTTAAYNAFTTGSLTWTDGTHKVRSTIAIRPVGAKVSAEVAGTGTSGSGTLTLTPGFTGTLSATTAGLVAGNVHTGTLTSPSGASFPTTTPTASAHTLKYTVTVPAGTVRARFAIFDKDVAAGTDMDLFVYQGGTATLLGSSTGGTAQEQVDLANPPAGTYDVYVDLYALAAGATSVVAKPYDWELTAASAGNLSVSPASRPVTLATPVTETVSWSGLTAGQRYLGRITWSDGTATAATTLVRVDA